MSISRQSHADRPRQHYCHPSIQHSNRDEANPVLLDNSSIMANDGDGSSTTFSGDTLQGSQRDCGFAEHFLFCCISVAFRPASLSKRFHQIKRAGSYVGFGKLARDIRRRRYSKNLAGLNKIALGQCKHAQTEEGPCWLCKVVVIVLRILGSPRVYGLLRNELAIRPLLEILQLEPRLKVSRSRSRYGICSNVQRTVRLFTGNTVELHGTQIFPRTLYISEEFTKAKWAVLVD